MLYHPFMLIITLLLTFAVNRDNAISSLANVNSCNQRIAWTMSKRFIIDALINFKSTIPSTCLIVVGLVDKACRATIR